MSDLEERITHLENVIEKMQLDQHASRVAIAVLSTALNGLVGKDTSLGDIYLDGIANNETVEFNNPVPDGYREKLHEKVAALLGSQK